MGLRPLPFSKSSTLRGALPALPTQPLPESREREGPCLELGQLPGQGLEGEGVEVTHTSTPQRM